MENLNLEWSEVEPTGQIVTWKFPFEVFALMWDFYMGFGCRVSMPSLSVGFSCWILGRYLSTGLFTKNAIVSNIPSFYVT